MKIKGFTLVETMVAMLLVALSFGIWMTVISNVGNGEGSQRFYIDYHIDREFSKILNEKNYFDRDYTVEKIDYSRKVAFSETSENIIEIELIAYLKGWEICRRKKLLYESD